MTYIFLIYGCVKTILIIYVSIGAIFGGFMTRLEQLNFALENIDLTCDFEYKYPKLKNHKEQVKLFEYKTRLLDDKFTRVEYDEFYREIFGYDTLQEVGNRGDLKFNAIALDYYSDKDNKIYPHNGIINNDLKEYEYFVNTDSPCVITNGITYIGRNRRESNARYMYAMIIDLDYVGTEDKVLNLLHQFEHLDNVITPTYLVNSGTGFHLYYVWDKPIPMFKKNRDWIRKLQNRVQRMAWNDYTSMRAANEDLQKLNITQGYRMVGTATKLGKEYRCTAYRVGDTFSIDSFDWFLQRQKINDKTLQTSKELQMVDPNHITLKKAEVLYPEWYQERIIEGKPKHQWNVNRRLYDWFLNKIKDNESIEGSRYFRVTSLASFARKCNISQEEFITDATSLFEHLNKGDHNTEFTPQDMEDAIEFYNLEYNFNLTRERLEDKSKIPMPANKRNGQKQSYHLEEARMLRDMRQKRNGTKWQDKSGRKPKKEQVRELVDSNPNASNKELERISGISRKTIIKWKRVIEEEQGNANMELEFIDNFELDMFEGEFEVDFDYLVVKK